MGFRHKSTTIVVEVPTGDRGRGGSNLRGGEHFEFPGQGLLKLTPFCRDSLENRQFGAQKSKSSRGNFQGEFPPLQVFGTF